MIVVFYDYFSNSKVVINLLIIVFKIECLFNTTSTTERWNNWQAFGILIVQQIDYFVFQNLYS